MVAGNPPIPERPAHRLAAIMAADIVGYSRMMSENESDALAHLRRFRNDLLGPAVSRHGGEVVKNMGDGWLAEFSSALGAVNCATDIQDRLAADGSIEIRIGIHIGDIFHEEDDIFGDGVNIAARLQQLAEPGAVLISGEVHKLVDRKQDAAFRDLGVRRLKNLPDDATIYGWASPNNVRQTLISTAGQTRVRHGLPTILVDELRVSGAREEASDLAEDIRYELLLVLSRRTGIKVLSEPNDQVRPKYVIAGRCRVSGDRARVDISMESGSGGENIWAQRFEDDGGEQDRFITDIARRISVLVRTHTASAEGADIADVPDAELSVQELLSKAAYLNFRWNQKSAGIAQTSLAAALEQDPDNPMAMAMLAITRLSPLIVGYGRGPIADADRIMELVNRAVSLGPKSDIVFLARAQCRLWLLRNAAGAIDDVERALRINPDYAELHALRGSVEVLSGDPETGVRRLSDIQDMMSITPIYPFVLFSMGLGYLFCGQHDKALKYAREGYDLAPEFPNSGTAYAAAAAGNADIVNSAEFRTMIDRLGLSQSIADNLPLSRDADIELVRSRLEAAGVPK